MKQLVLLAALIISLQAAAQVSDGTYYVAARTGLSIREKADPASKVLDKIPYGTKISTIPEDGDWKVIETENLTGYWKKVKYNNKTGYIVDSYLIPWAPPKLATIKELKQYLAQVAGPFGQKLVTKSGTMNYITESGWELRKQLYKNGAELQEFYAYEYNSDTYLLPGFSLQQGFILCRLIPEFKEVFGEKDEFPTSSKIIKKGEKEYDIKVIRTGGDETDAGPFNIEKIKISFEDGAYYQFEMYMLENQLVVFFSGGV